jgi:hypothetical protein
VAEARDGFSTYFTEKIWEMIPPVYRDEDGRAANPGVLRALVEILAEHAAVLRRSHDRLWDDEFVDLADDWAVPYLADLVATRLVSALNTRGRRVDVAKTIYYRRRKGTLAVLEELIADITGWDGTVVEEFRRLGRTRHGLDASPARGRFTGTPSGGWADLRSPRGEELAGGPFGEFYFTADTRRHRGIDGRHGIPKLSFHLYRLFAFEVRDATPAPGPDARSFTIDPSGRDVPLFMPRSRPAGWAEWRRALEWELPGPISCRVLGNAEFEIGEGLVLDLVANHGLPAAAATELRTLRGYRLTSDARLVSALAELPAVSAWLTSARLLTIRADALVTDCGQAALVPNAIRVREGANPVARELVTAGDLTTWALSPPGRRAVIDPERGRLRFVGVAPGSDLGVRYHYGFSAPIGAGTYDRRDIEGGVPSVVLRGGGAIGGASLPAAGLTQIDDDGTYRIGSGANRNDITGLSIQAGNQRRPFLALTSSLRLGTAAGAGANLTLDGLWIGAAGGTEIVLAGDFGVVAVRRCTLDPGGVDAGGGAIAPVSLIVEGHADELLLDRSITGPVRTRAGGAVEKLVVRDSITQSRLPAFRALDFDAGEAIVERVTIFGRCGLHRLSSSDSIFASAVEVTDTQAGCFRFSAAPAGSRLPRPYRSYLFAGSESFFTSGLFGDPGFAQLSEAAPMDLVRGAESGSQMGAFSGALDPIKLDGLTAKADEFMPFGLIPSFVKET